MQRFTVALFALVAIFALVLPSIDARASGLRRMDTNAARLRRGEGLMPPANLKRHAPSKVEAAKRHGPSLTPGGPPGGSTGNVQCRGNDGKTIGYLGPNGTVKRGTDGAASLSYSRSSGKISIGGGGIFGALLDSFFPFNGGLKIDVKIDVNESENAIIWDIEESTGKMTPSYIDTDGTKTPCSVERDENSGKLTFTTSPTNPVSLYFLQ
jgi:hypothetical protein